jgi:hypothetical protein
MRTDNKVRKPTLYTGGPVSGGMLLEDLLRGE